PDLKVTELIFTAIHKNIGHNEHNHVQSHLHQRYLIPNAPSAIKSPVEVCDVVGFVTMWFWIGPKCRQELGRIIFVIQRFIYKVKNVAKSLQVSQGKTWQKTKHNHG
ncbi:hypothetical protein AMECASPLE_037545, partial [Ameca splendens]